MIDTLHTDQRLKIKLHGSVEQVQIKDHDPVNDMLWCERGAGKSPRMCAVSYPMIYAVWDQYNEEWAIFKLPSEEEMELEQIMNLYSHG